ncbi:MAG TPA: TlpA disulfide reductase family protein [Actinomycetota bacterium]|jgi:thiol-disulfide isomerase/thioredoxin
MAADLNADPDPDLGQGSQRGPASRPSTRRVVRDAVVLAVVLAGLALLVFRPGGSEPGGAGGDRSCRPQPGVLLGAGKVFPASCPVKRFEGGKKVPFADLQAGKPLVVNFWASWCSACLKEMPGYQQVYAAGSGRFELVGVDVVGTLQTIAGDTETAGRAFARQMGVHYPLVFDEDWLLYRHFNSQPTLPTTLFVRPDGVVAHMRIGPYAPGELAAGIRRYLGIDVAPAGVRS